MHQFDKYLSVCIEDIDLELRGFIEWEDYFLNPRRLRGSDFLMRWSQGVWSEHRIIDAINSTDDYWAIPYGPSSVAPDNDIRAFELYFERLEAAGLGEIKRPDILVFDNSDRENIESVINRIGDIKELPFTRESDLRDLIDRAIFGIECENSLWIAEKMRNYGESLRPMRRLGGKEGLPTSAVVPTVILKEEDLAPLKKWQDDNNKDIHIWHVFFDRAYGISLNRALELIEQELISETNQTFQAPGGQTSTKIIYKIYYHYAYLVGEASEDPELKADYIDSNGHILPFVKFEGGKLNLSEQALNKLRENNQ